MFVGHIGAALAVNRFEKRLNLGVVLLAALFADILLWALVLCGVEAVLGSETTGRARFFSFDFPYSHGLAPSVVWAALAGAVGWILAPRGAPLRSRTAFALALAVASHVVLDWVVHVPDIPAGGPDSPKVGLGLWRHMPVALAFELLVAAVALAVYLRGRDLSRGKALLLIGTVAATGALTAVGPYLPGEVPPTNVLALTSLTMLTAVVLIGFFVDGAARRPRPH